MRTTVFVLATMLTMWAASGAQAQETQPTAQPPQQQQQRPWWEWSPFGGKLFININGAIQPGDQTVNRSTTFDLYEEQGTFTSSQAVKGSAMLDVGGGYRIRRNYGIGVSYTRFTTIGDGSVSGMLPHPLVFDRQRAFNASASDLIHKEQAVHVSAMWFVPFVENVDFAFFAGPSFFIDVDQDFPIGVTFTDDPPSFDTATINEVREGRGSEPAVGFNIGGDISYAIMPNFGFGLMLRYTRATVDFNVGGISNSLTAGSAQIAAGARLRF